MYTKASKCPADPKSNSNGKEMYLKCLNEAIDS